jgi:hypothetical protein
MTTMRRLAAILAADVVDSRQSNRLPANKHNSTDPDVTAVTLMLIRLPTAVESTEIGRSVRRSDFGLRILAAMASELGVRLPAPDSTLSCRADPDRDPSIACVLDETLKRVVNQTHYLDGF